MFLFSLDLLSFVENATLDAVQLKKTLKYCIYKNLDMVANISTRKLWTAITENVSKQVAFWNMFATSVGKKMQWFGFHIRFSLQYGSCSLFLLLFCMDITFQITENFWALQILPFYLVKCTQLKKITKSNTLLKKHFSMYFGLENKKPILL